MKNLGQIIFLACGLLLTLASSSVVAQDVKEVEINRRPLQDFSQIVLEKVNKDKVDLTKSFSIELEGVLMKDGRLDLKKSRFTKSEGDAAMIEIGRKFIEAVNDSGAFQYLKNFGAEKINFSLSQDEKQAVAIINSETATAEKAKTIASGINALFMMARMQNKNEEDKLLLSYFSVAADGKNFVINFAAPRETIQELVKKNLEKMAAKASSR